MLARNQHIARILTLTGYQQTQTFRLHRWHILQTMHRDINPPLSQSPFNLNHKHTIPADLGERNMRHRIAGRADRLNNYLQVGPVSLELCDNPARLNHRQFAGPRADYQTFHLAVLSNQTNNVQPQHRHTPGPRQRHP